MFHLCKKVLPCLDKVKSIDPKEFDIPYCASGEAHLWRDFLVPVCKDKELFIENIKCIQPVNTG